MGFAKGQTGNPNGRPRLNGKQQAVVELARAYCPMAIRELAKVARKGKTESARVAASIALLDRGWGKPATIIAGDANAPLRVTVLRFSDEPEAIEPPGSGTITINGNGHAVED